MDSLLTPRNGSDAAPDMQQSVGAAQWPVESLANAGKVG